MATRATYELHELDKEPVCLYLHWDGYPEGAAMYFRRWLEEEKHTVLGFLKANPKAEITDGHEAHGDTEYRYTVHLKGSMDNGCVVPETWVKAEEKKYGRAQWEGLPEAPEDVVFYKWEQLFNGTLQEFVDKYDKLVDIPTYTA
jgi:hypothetical protein